MSAVVERTIPEVAASLGLARRDEGKILTFPRPSFREGGDEIFSRDRRQRAKKLQEMLAFGTVGVHDYGGLCAIPVPRNVLYSDFYDAHFDPFSEDVLTKFFQYQEGLDERFGVVNGHGWKQEVSSVLAVRVYRDREMKSKPWKMDFKILHGDDLSSAILSYRRLVWGEHGFKKRDSEDFKMMCLESTDQQRASIAEVKAWIKQEVGLLDKK